MNRAATLSDVPDDLLRRVRGNVSADQRRSVRMADWIMGNVASTVTLWQVHEERVRRGFEEPWDMRAALARRRTSKRTRPRSRSLKAAA